MKHVTKMSTEAYFDFDEGTVTFLKLTHETNINIFHHIFHIPFCSFEVELVLF